jgi:hypothetical protein
MLLSAVGLVLLIACANVGVHVRPIGPAVREFVARPPLGAGASPRSRRANAHRSDRQACQVLTGEVKGVAVKPRGGVPTPATASASLTRAVCSPRAERTAWTRASAPARIHPDASSNSPTIRPVTCRMFAIRARAARAALGQVAHAWSRAGGCQPNCMAGTLRAPWATPLHPRRAIPVDARAIPGCGPRRDGAAVARARHARPICSGVAEGLQNRAHDVTDAGRIRSLMPSDDADRSSGCSCTAAARPASSSHAAASNRRAAR